MGRWPAPVADIELWVLALFGDATDEDGIALRAQLMHQHLGVGRGDGGRMPVVVQIAVGGLCPFQGDIRPMELVKCEKTTVKPMTFVLKDACGHVDAGIAEFLDAAALNLCEGVDATYNNPSDSFADDEVGAGWSFAKV